MSFDRIHNTMNMYLTELHCFSERKAEVASLFVRFLKIEASTLHMKTQIESNNCESAYRLKDSARNKNVEYTKHMTKLK